MSDHTSNYLTRYRHVLDVAERLGIRDSDYPFLGTDKINVTTKCWVRLALPGTTLGEPYHSPTLGRVVPVEATVDGVVIGALLPTGATDV